MLENRLGVSPPQAGKTPDSKVTQNKDFRETVADKNQYKSDFEAALKQQKLQKEKADLEKQKQNERREELRADAKIKKSSGGTKKRMADENDKIVSSNMASSENVVEAPKKEESAKISVNSNEKKISKVEESVSADGAVQAGPSNESDSAAKVQPQVERLVPNSAELAKPVEAEVSSKLFEVNQSANLEQQVDLAKGMQQPTEMVAEVDKSLLRQATPPNAEENKSTLSDLEAQLALASGYKPEVSMQEPVRTDLKSLKSELEKFEAKPANSENAASQIFEKSVLNQLQKEASYNGGGQSSNSKDSESQFKGDKLEKLDLTTSNELHQAAGQSHGGFKAHLAVPAGTGGLDLSSQLSDKLEANREANLNEVMKQAQYLVKQGGGEVSVKMSPEGLGEVHLKVQLLDGKLNVEMQTQDKHVKKLIEESLSDLKSGLAAHRLSLEHVKIDTVNATNTDNSAQLQSNLNQGSSEKNAQNFWEQSQKQFDQQSANSQGRQGAREFTLSPNVSPQVSTARATQAQALRTYGGTKGATINRVA